MDLFYFAIVLLLLGEAGCKRVGLVDEQSMPAWLLLPRSGPTVSWLKRSKPGQVFAVLQMDTRQGQGLGPNQRPPLGRPTVRISTSFT